MAKMDDIIARLKEMKGTVYAFPLEHACRSRITEIEKEIKATLGIPVINKGVEKCLEREYVVCIIKRASFRPPPEPTVLLVSDDGVVLGEEILPNRKKAFLDTIQEDILWLSEEFVMYPGRKGNKREFFIMPPVSFPEVAEMGMRNVVSCSPSAPADMMLRQMHGYDDDPKMASILIGFDSDEGIL